VSRPASERAATQLHWARAKDVALLQSATPISWQHNARLVLVVQTYPHSDSGHEVGYPPLTSAIASPIGPLAARNVKGIEARLSFLGSGLGPPQFTSPAPPPHPGPHTTPAQPSPPPPTAGTPTPRPRPLPDCFSAARPHCPPSGGRVPAATEPVRPRRSSRPRSLPAPPRSPPPSPASRRSPEGRSPARTSSAPRSSPSPTPGAPPSPPPAPSGPSPPVSACVS